MKRLWFEKLMFKLLRDEDVSLTRAGIIADTIVNEFDPRMDESIEHFMRGESIKTLAVGDISFQSIMNSFRCNELEALFIVNIALKDNRRLGKLVTLNARDGVHYDD